MQNVAQAARGSSYCSDTRFRFLVEKCKRIAGKQDVKLGFKNIAQVSYRFQSIVCAPWS